MGKITDYPKVSAVQAADTFLLDGENGTKGILGNDLASGLLKHITANTIASKFAPNNFERNGVPNGNTRIYCGNYTHSKIEVTLLYELYWPMVESIALRYGPIIRRNLFRGHNLGDVFTTDQRDAIRAGTFDDMFVGDFWHIGGNIYRIADFDYWLNTGGDYMIVPAIHHVVIVPDWGLSLSQMNPTADMNTGYLNSKMNLQEIPAARNVIKSHFGAESLLTYDDFVTNSSAGSNVATALDVAVPTYEMIFGTRPDEGGWLAPNYDKTQLALFSLYPNAINQQRQAYWLRDLYGSAACWAVSYSRTPWSYNADISLALRPVFGLTGNYSMVG